MPALQPLPNPRLNLTAGRDDCPRCGGRYLGRDDLRCIACGAEFTPEGLEHFRALPASQARRT